MNEVERTGTPQSLSNLKMDRQPAHTLLPDRTDPNYLSREVPFFNRTRDLELTMNHPAVRREPKSRDFVNEAMSENILRQQRQLSFGGVFYDEVPSLTRGDNFNPTPYIQQTKELTPIHDYGDRLELRGSVQDNPANNREIARDRLRERTFFR